MTACRRYVVTGRVQGVGFRWFARREAVRLGLRGVVRNLPDGTVEVLAEGSEEALRHLAAVLARGPALARVDAIAESAPPAGTRLPDGFETA